MDSSPHDSPATASRVRSRCSMPCRDCRCRCSAKRSARLERASRVDWGRPVGGHAELVQAVRLVHDHARDDRCGDRARRRRFAPPAWHPDDIDRITCHVNPLAPQVAGHRIRRPGSRASSASPTAARSESSTAARRPTASPRQRRRARRHPAPRLGCMTSSTDAAIGEQQSRVTVRLHDGGTRERIDDDGARQPRQSADRRRARRQVPALRDAGARRRAPPMCWPTCTASPTLDDVGRWLDSLR